MKVKTLLETKGKDVVSMDGDSSVEDAIRLMHGKKISAIIITGKNKPAGIFTERDVVRCYIKKAGKKKFREIAVKNAMTTNLIVAETDDDLSSVMAIMVEKNIRHLPVVDEGEIVGILSIRDIIQTQVHKLTSEIHYLKDFIVDS